MKNSIFRLSFAAAATAIVLLASLSYAQTPPAGSPVATHGRLRVEGSNIVGQHGNPVQLRGMSLYWSITSAGWNFYNADAVKWLASDWKADVIRAAMGVETDFWNDQQGYINNPNANKQRVQAVVQGAREAGIYVIIDWHSHRAQYYQTQAENFFREMATAYKDVPNVIYEIYNEPLGPSPNAQVIAYWRDSVKTYSQAVVDAIRAIDTNNIILIGTPRWCQRPDIAADDPVTGKNLAYTAHFYSNSNADHKATLRNRIFYTMNKGYPVFVSEFGLTDEGGDNALNIPETDRWMAFMDQFKIGWANWGIGTWGQTAAALNNGAPSNGNWQSHHITASGNYVRNRLRSSPSTSKAYNTLTINLVGEGTAVSNRWVSEIGSTEATSEFTIQATPASGWRFVSWSGDHSSNEAQSRITLPSDKVLTATFEPIPSSALPAPANVGATRWSVRRDAGGLSVRGPSIGGAVEVRLYDVRGKLVGGFTHNAPAGQPIIIGNITAPAGNYLMTIRNKATGREIHRIKVSLVK